MRQQEREYGWSPENLAIINRQREQRGQAPIVDRRMREGGEFASTYTTASEDYATRQERMRQRQSQSDEKEEERRRRREDMIASNRAGMQQRERDRMNLGRMNVDYLKMRQAGGNMNWEDFKKMWGAPKVMSPQGMNRYA